MNTEIDGISWEITPKGTLYRLTRLNGVPLKNKKHMDADAPDVPPQIQRLRQYVLQQYHAMNEPPRGRSRSKSLPPLNRPKTTSTKNRRRSQLARKPENPNEEKTVTIASVSLAPTTKKSAVCHETTRTMPKSHSKRPSILKTSRSKDTIAHRRRQFQHIAIDPRFLYWEARQGKAKHGRFYFQERPTQRLILLDRHNKRLYCDDYNPHHEHPESTRHRLVSDHREMPEKYKLPLRDLPFFTLLTEGPWDDHSLRHWYQIQKTQYEIYDKQLRKQWYECFRDRFDWDVLRGLWWKLEDMEDQTKCTRLRNTLQHFLFHWTNLYLSAVTIDDVQFVCLLRNLGKLTPE